MSIPRVLVAVFQQAVNVGGSDATISLTQHLDADLTYLVADIVAPAQEAFARDPVPRVIHNRLRPKPHMKVGTTSCRTLLERNWDLYRDALWLYRQERIVNQVSADVTCSMTSLLLDADIFVVQFLRAASYQNFYGVEPDRATRTLHALDLKEWFTLWTERQNMKRRNHRALVVTSEAMRRTVLEHYDVDPDRIVLVRNAIDTQVFHPPASPMDRAEARKRLGIGPSAFVVLFVGRSPERKGIDTALHAFSRMQTERVKQCVLVGFSDNAVVRDLVAEHGIAPLILGEVSRPLLTETVYPAADVLVLPSRFEPYGGVILEAMASALPVVVSPQCGAAEIIVKTAQDSFSRTPLRSLRPNVSWSGSPAILSGQRPWVGRPVVRWRRL